MWYACVLKIFTGVWTTAWVSGCDNELLSTEEGTNEGLLLLVVTCERTYVGAALPPLTKSDRRC